MTRRNLITRVGLAVLVPLVFAGCINPRQDPGERKNNETEVAELRKLQGADPVVDLRDAITKGDLRFLAITGFGIGFPGVLDFEERFPNSKYRLIEGTTDAPFSKEHQRLQEVAKTYAERYNRLLVRYLETGIQP